MRGDAVHAPYLRGTKQAYLLQVTISIQNSDIFITSSGRQYFWYLIDNQYSRNPYF